MLVDVSITFIITVSSFIVITYSYILLQLALLRRQWKGLEGLIQSKFSAMAALIPILSDITGLDREFLKGFTACVQGYIRSRTIEETIAANTRAGYYLRELDKRLAAYPKLRDDAGFLEHHGEFIAAEEKISFACQFYNKGVANFNKTINILPISIVAGIFNIKPKKTI